MFVSFAEAVDKVKHNVANSVLESLHGAYVPVPVNRARGVLFRGINGIDAAPRTARESSVKLGFNRSTGNVAGAAQLLICDYCFFRIRDHAELV